MKIIIMAGGAGSRLWPISRKEKPKQFQKLLGDQTMLQESVLRLLPDFDMDNIFIATNTRYKAEIIHELPELSEDNIILEPAKQDTAPAIGLASVLATDDGTESLAFLTADHYIQQKEEFRHILRIADQYLQEHPSVIVTLGITPTSPETGYGYIKTGQIETMVEQIPVHRVEAFVEKPSLDVAERYLKEETYLWNSGMFIVRRDTLLEHFKKRLPNTYEILRSIADAKSRPDLQEVIDTEYRRTDKISIDYGIMEGAQDTVVIPASIGWSDIGSWAALKDIVMQDVQLPHLHHIGRGKHIDFGSKRLLVHSDSDKLIATVGLQDVVIVETDDILLVCNKHRSQEVKKIVELLETENVIDKL